MSNEYTIEQDIQEIMNDGCYTTQQRLEKISEIMDTHYHHREGDRWFGDDEEMIEYLQDNTDYYVFMDFSEIKDYVSANVEVFVTVNLESETVLER